jgi:cellular nucleic acid-binding protein
MLSAKKQAQLDELRALSAPLSDKQARRLAKLQALETAAEPAAAAGHSKKQRADAPSERPPVKATSTGVGAVITCSSCSVVFDFSADEQLTYTTNGWYVPSRCAECSAAKKERFDAKQAKKAAASALASNRCFNCGEPGHLASGCPKPRVAKDAPKTCYHCGSDQHLSRACTQPVKRAAPKRKACFNCGSMDHEKADCPQPLPTPICFNCGAEVGSDEHPLRNCVHPKRASGVCFAFRLGRCDRKNCKFDHDGPPAR